MSEKNIGQYKLWQLRNIQKMYEKLGYEFNLDELSGMSRADLKELTAQLRMKIGGGKTTQKIRPRIEVYD